MKVVRGIGFFLTTIVIYLGLPLLGWGLDDFLGFFSLHQMLGYSVIITIFGMVAVYQAIKSPEGVRGGKGQNGKFIPRQRIVRIFVSGLLLGALVLIPFADRRSIGTMASSDIARWLGLVLSTCGMGLIFWSGLALGWLYSPEVTIQKDHHLVTNEPYHYVRHPRYLGGVIQGIGLSFLFRSWIGLALTLLFIFIVLFRIRDEEALMSREFKEEWAIYCKKSWRLIPFIY